MTNFPTLSTGIDSSTFEQTIPEDPTASSESEGGYVITRPRFTRIPRKTFNFSFTDVSEADRVAFLDVFYAQTVLCSALNFNWTHPVTGIVHDVRFKSGSIPRATYRGKGTNYRWDISGITLVEV
jgi:hypothetical protein